MCQNTYTYPLRFILFYVNSFIFKWDLIKLIFPTYVLLPRLDRHQLIEQILKFQLTTTLLCSLSCESCSPEKIPPREKEKSLKRAEKKREKRYTSFLDLRVSRSPFAFRYRLATPSPYFCIFSDHEAVGVERGVALAQSPPVQHLSWERKVRKVCKSSGFYMQWPVFLVLTRLASPRTLILWDSELVAVKLQPDSFLPEPATLRDRVTFRLQIIQLIGFISPSCAYLFGYKI